MAERPILAARHATNPTGPATTAGPVVIYGHINMAIYDETLIGYALNRLIRGDTTQEAYYSLRRDEQFGWASTAQIRGAVQTATRLRTQAGWLESAGPGESLLNVPGARYKATDIIGYRVVFHSSQARGYRLGPSTVIDLPAGTQKEDIFRAAMEKIMSTSYQDSRPSGAYQSYQRGEIYAILPGGYQSAAKASGGV